MLTKSIVRQLKQEVARESDKLSVVFGALSDRGRLRMFRLLLKHEGLCVTEIANVFGISVPAASQQLKVMEVSGLVERKREGQMICYSVNKKLPVVKLMEKAISLEEPSN
jgi:DNA-binding transcriptional ArsR family regulator